MEQSKLRTAIGLILSTGMSNRHIGRELEIAYNTIRRYRSIAHDSAFGPDELINATDTALEAKFKNPPTRDSGKRLPDWEHVHRELQRKGVTRTLLWMEYRELDPTTAYELSRFNELYVIWAGKQATSMRQQHEPGERGWVDFSGSTMSWVDPSTGERHDAQIFVASLGVSGMLFALAVPSQRQDHWIHAHCEWYDAMGGVPRITVTDNLKAAVLKSGREPTLNPAYVDMARHYQTFILPARSGRPKDKAKAELSVLIFLRWGIARLRNRVFHSMAELNVAITESVDLINGRVVRHLKQSRRERFDAIDKPHLLPLPARYEYGEWIGPQRVALDYHIAIDGHFYSVPSRLVQQLVHARCTASIVEIFCERTRVASHLRSDKPGEKTTDRSHMPEQHRAWIDHTPERYLQWAQGIAPQVHAVVERLLADARHPTGALNACSNLQKLARTHGHERFVLACTKALSIHSPTVKSIRSILQNRLEGRGDPPSARQMPQHNNIRGANYYHSEEASNVG